MMADKHCSLCKDCIHSGTCYRESNKRAYKGDLDISECKYYKSAADVVEAEKAMEWISKYAFADNDEVYTNGSMLVPLFRVKQALIDKSYEGLKEATP